MRRFTVFAALLGISAAACSDAGPTAPEPTETDGPTTLAVEPDAAIVPGDPSGLVSLSVWPHEAGGQVTIEACMDGTGHAVAAKALSTCEELGGQWEIARDGDGVLWIARTWHGYATVRFDRQPEQPPMLFRTTYEAPRGGATRSIRGCRWVLAERSDVGVACTSDNDVRALPWVGPESTGPAAT